VLAVQQQGPGVGEQVDADQGEFEPGLVDCELAGREPAEAGVLASADAIFHTGVGSVAQLEQVHRADRPGGVGDEDLVAQALDGVENAQLGAGMWVFPAHDHPCPSG
jgi:hypothetical protein